MGVSGAIAIDTSPALAQSKIIPDRTLGAEESIVVPNSGGFPVEAIGGGAIRGANLFHSFQEFNVSAGRGAYFYSPTTTIQNILARVTGNNSSEILGTLGTYGNSNPNLFLINPNGIIFGPNASLDVGGSFVASTASAIKLANGKEFSAINPKTPPLLTINVPVGLQYSGNPGSIIVQRSGLQVPNDRTLALVGGTVGLDGAFLQAGRVELGAVAGTGTVGLNVDGSNLSLSFPQGVALADISLTNAAEVNVLAGGGGSIAVNAQNLNLAQKSALLAGIDSGLGSTISVAGNIDISATGAIALDDESAIENVVGKGVRGQGGDINITSSQLRVSKGSQIGAGTFGTGKGGNLTIKASDSVQVSGSSADGQHPSGLFAQTEGKGNAGNLTITASQLQVSDGATVSASTSGTGNAGNLTITTAQLQVSDGATVSAGTFGAGKGGSLTVKASDVVQVSGTSADGQSLSGLSTQTQGTGNAGNLTIMTSQLRVSDGAQVSAGTFSAGKGGSLIVNASDSVQVSGTSADGQHSSGLSTQTSGAGDAGNLTLMTSQLRVSDGAQVSAGTFGTGNGGSLTVTATKGVQVIGTSADGQSPSGLFADSLGTGKAQNLTINTSQLQVSGGAQVSTGTNGAGKGGSLIVNAVEGVQVIGTSADGQNPSRLLTQTSGTEDAGDLTIMTSQLRVSDGAQVSASTFGAGNGGSLIVNATKGVQVLGTSADGQSPSGLFASTSGTGDAGNLTITTSQLQAAEGGQVSADTLSSGKGGSLTVKASDSVQLFGLDSGLFVDATAGSTAGNLTVETQQMSISDQAGLSVSSPKGQAGNMTIQANSLLLNRGRLSAETAKSGAQGGANITLQGLDLLRLDNESLISANANDQANGGNITIDSTFIVATPPTGLNGSDITANAGKGNGGQVNITTQGLYGIEFRPQLTPKNDITVSSNSGLNGTFQLNTPGVDPSRGLANLQTETIDASRQIVQDCRAGGAATRKDNKFIITGRGGVPPSPNDMLQGESVVTNWVTLDSDIEKKNNTPQAVTPSHPLSSQLVEAQGWVVNKTGQIVLTASSPTVTPQSEGLNPAKCKAVSIPDRD